MTVIYISGTVVETKAFPLDTPELDIARWKEATTSRHMTTDDVEIEFIEEKEGGLITLTAILWPL